jgi:hypothetical protein
MTIVLAVWLRMLMLITISTLFSVAQMSPVTVATGVLPSSTSFSSQRKIVRYSQGNLFTAYLRTVENHSQVFLSESAGNGTAWREIGQVSEGNYDSVRVSVAMDSEDRVHIFWTQFIGEYGQIMYRTYGRAGWSMVQQLTSGEAYSGFPSAAFDSEGRLHLVWYGYDGIAYQVYYIRLEGGTWSTPVKLSQGFPDSVNPTVAVDSRNNIHVAWYKSNGRHYQINYLRWSNGWGPQLVLSSGLEDAFNPSIAVDSRDDVYVVWDAGQGPRTQIYYAAFKAGEWSEQESLTSGDAGARNPSIAIDAQDSVYVFYDKSDGQIYLKEFSGSWVPEEKLTETGENTFPSVRWSYYSNPSSGAGGQIDYVWTSANVNVTSLMYSEMSIVEKPGSRRQPFNFELAAIAVTGILVLAILPIILSTGNIKETRADSSVLFWNS